MAGVFEAGLVTVGLLILRALAGMLGLSWQFTPLLQALLTLLVFVPLGWIWWIHLARTIVDPPSSSSSPSSTSVERHREEHDGHARHHDGRHDDDDDEDDTSESSDDDDEDDGGDREERKRDHCNVHSIAGSHQAGYRELQRDEIVLLQEKPLSYGAFSVVYRGEWRGVECAVKQINMPVVDQKAKEEFRKEASLMQELGHHPNIVTFFGAVTSGHCMWLVTEFHKMGSIHEFYSKYRRKMSSGRNPPSAHTTTAAGSELPVPLPLIVKLAADAALGVLHLHRENVIHRDLAARNVLVGGSFKSGFRAVISDFGLSRVKSNSAVTLSNIGPVKWMAPEAIVNKEYSEASDAWSFGVLLWEMVTGRIPWEEEDALNVAVKVGKENQRLPLPPDCDEVLAELMTSCWEHDPKRRPTFSEIHERLQAYSEELKEEGSSRTKHKPSQYQTHDEPRVQIGSGGGEYHQFETQPSEEDSSDNGDEDDAPRDFAQIADDYHAQRI